MQTEYTHDNRIFKVGARLMIAASLLLTLLAAAPAFAQDGGDNPDPLADGVITDDEVNAIAEQLYCPVCENVPLDVCGTQACADWRADIRQMLEEGKTEQEIIDHFVQSYGLRVLATPEARGISVLVWALPVAGVVIGAGVLALALRRMAPAKASAPAAVSYDDLDPAYVARLEQELKEYNS